MALVWHPEVQSVRPQRGIAEGGCERGIVEEGLLFHHRELAVAADPQVRGPNPDDGIVRDVPETFQDQPHSGHFFGPRVETSLGPVFLDVPVTIIRRNRELVRSGRY